MWSSGGSERMAEIESMEQNIRLSLSLHLYSQRYVNTAKTFFLEVNARVVDLSVS